MSVDALSPGRMRAQRLQVIERLALRLTADDDMEVASLAFLLIEWLKEGARTPLDVALELRGGPGCRTAATEAQLAQRDALLSRAAAEFWPGLSASGQAAALHLAWSRYAASGWQRERTASSVPPSRIGTAEAFFFQIMRLRDHVLTESRVRRILATSSPYSLPALPANLG